MKSNLSLVTALFDIGRGDMGTSFSRSFDHYKECFARLLRLTNFNMVIFCEPELESFIWQHRDPSNTKIITKTLNDLRNFPFYDEVQKIRLSESWRGQAGWLTESTQGELELYNPLVMSKQFFLNDASLYNFFNTDYFLWVDAGLANTVSLEGYFDDTFEDRITPLLNKMLYICYPYGDEHTPEVHGFEKRRLDELAGKRTTRVARGGVFGGHRSVINTINDIYYNYLQDTLREGYMGTEESLFTIITYKYPNLCNLHMIEDNGLVYKFFEDIRHAKRKKRSEQPLAFYTLTYNTPKQFKMFVDAFKKAYPDDFEKRKKYVVDNSTDSEAIKEYREIFKENDFEIIHEGRNVGIQDGRQLIANHFAESDHDYYIFFEEDFLLVSADDQIQNTKGFVRYIPDIFNKMIRILDEQKLDYLRMTILEFFGDNTFDWSFKNLPKDRLEEFFPTRSDGDEELRWKTKIDYLGFLDSGTIGGFGVANIAYAVGDFHISNWPILFNQKGNHTVYLEIVYEHLYEQTIMSQAKMHMKDGKLKGGCLLAAPLYHDRAYHYDGTTRRENRHYTN